jgi:acyl carrier protein
MTLEAGIREMIVSQGATSGLDDVLTDDLPLFETQALDSLGMFELIVNLEQRFGIEIFDEEAVPENLGTVTAIARFVETKLANRTTG